LFYAKRDNLANSTTKSLGIAPVIRRERQIRVCPNFKGSVRESGGVAGSTGDGGSEQFHQARLVRITHRGLAIWLNPLGMLDPQIIANLSEQFCEDVDFVGHGNDSAESRGPRDGSFVKATTESSTGNDAVGARQ